jgi:hypothetical protein
VNVPKSRSFSDCACQPLARLACQRKVVTHESLEVRWRGRCAEGRHNPNSGDWDTIEVVVTTAIEVQARKRRQRQQERGQERYLLQKPLLQTARIIGGSGSCSSGRQWRWQFSSSRHSCCGSQHSQVQSPAPSAVTVTGIGSPHVQVPSKQIQRRGRDSNPR